MLKPELRPLLVPLLDAQVTIEERIEIANRLVGAPVESAEQAVGDAARERGLLAAVVRRVRGRHAAAARARAMKLRRFEASGDRVRPRKRAERAKRRLAGEVQPLRCRSRRRRIWAWASGRANHVRRTCEVRVLACDVRRATSLGLGALVLFGVGATVRLCSVARISRSSRIASAGATASGPLVR